MGRYYKIQYWLKVLVNVLYLNFSEDNSSDYFYSQIWHTLAVIVVKKAGISVIFQVPGNMFELTRLPANKTLVPALGNKLCAHKPPGSRPDPVQILSGSRLGSWNSVPESRPLVRSHSHLFLCMLIQISGYI